MKKKVVVGILAALGLAVSLLGSLGDAHSTYKDLVEAGRQALAAGDLGVSTETLYFGVGTAFLALFLVLIQRVLHEPESESQELREQRRQILNEPDVRQRYLKWLKLDVENRLKESIHGALQIEIGIKEDREASRPWSFRTSTDSPQEFDNFDSAWTKFNGRCLILGAPGSGKTTTLLDAILKATHLALNDESAPIPVYFNLSSFQDRRSKGRLKAQQIPGADGLTSEDVDDLQQQMIAELAHRPATERRACEKWFEEGKLGLFLDGLDEVPEAYAAKLVQQINYGYCYRFTDRPLLVASRVIEYRTLQESREGGLRLDAITLQPLTKPQVEQYLAKIEDAEGLRAALKDDATLTEMASTPLTLSMMTLAYVGRSQEQISSQASMPQQRRELFDAFVEKMIQRQARRDCGKMFSLDSRDDVKPLYSVEEVNRYLGWLAVRLSEGMRTLFSVAGLYDVLRTQSDRNPRNPTVQASILIFFLLSAAGSLLLGLVGVTTFPFWLACPLLFLAGLSGLLLDIDDHFEIVLGALFFFYISLGILSLSPVAPNGWSGALLMFLLLVLTKMILDFMAAYSHPKRQDDPLRPFPNRSSRSGKFARLRKEVAWSLAGGIAGAMASFLIPGGYAAFNGFTFGYLLAMLVVTLGLTREGFAPLLLVPGFLLASWGAATLLSYIPIAGDPLFIGLLVFAVMGILFQGVADSAEGAVGLFVFVWASGLLFGSAGMTVGALFVLVIIAKLEGRWGSSVREHLASPCLILIVAFSRNLPYRMTRFIGFALGALLLKRNGQEIEFSHRIIRDHFATRDLVRQLAVRQGDELLPIIERLGAQGEAALDVLVSLLQEKDEKIREGAVRSLCRIRSEDSPIYLRNILRDDPSATVRAATLDAYGRLTGVEDFFSLAGRDSSPVVRAEAARRLSDLRYGDDAHDWLHFLTDSAPEVVRAALSKIGLFLSQRKTRLLDRSEHYQRFDRHLSDLEGRIQLSSIEGFRNAGWPTRCGGAYILRFPRTPGTVQVLEELAQDEDINVQIAAIDSLGKHGETEALGVLRAVFESHGDRAGQLQIAAVHSLGQIFSRPSGDIAARRDFLLRLLESRVPEIRAAVYRMLAGTLGADAIEYLVRGLADPEAEVQRESIITLGRTKGPLPPELLGALRIRTLSLAAAWALGERDDPSVREAVLSALGSRRRWLRVSAVLLAGKLEVREALPLLMKIQARERTHFSRFIAWFEDRLSQSLRRSAYSNRLELQSQLSRITDAVVESMQDENVRVSFYCTTASSFSFRRHDS